MTEILTRRLAPSPDAMESAVGDETVILHLKNGAYYGLDAVGTEIWGLLKQGLDPLTICAKIAADHGVDRSVVEVDATRFLTDLQAHDIIHDA